MAELLMRILGELWEIEGLLYIIAGKMVGGFWGNYLIMFGIISIIGGLIYQILKRKEL